MFGFFRAIGRYITAFFYLITGQIDEARKSLSSNPNVIAATYDSVVAEKTHNLQTYKEAVSGLIVQEENKKSKLKKLSEEIQKFENLRSGALTKAKKLAEQGNGNSEKIKTDPEYMKHQAAYRDFSSTLEEKKHQADEIEKDVVNIGKTIGSHKTRMEGLLRDLDKLKEEKQETIAEVLSAKEEKAISDMLSGISLDKSNKELQDMREMRQQIRASARVSREISGMDTSQQEQDYLSYAQSNKADDEFDKLIFKEVK